jgi:hypothetical protein
MKLQVQARHATKLLILGAFTFWSPDAVWHAIRSSKFNGRDAIALTILLPLIVLMVYVRLRKRYQSEGRKPIGWPLILGVWLLGGFFMTIGASFAGGGFAGQDGLSGGIKMVLISFLPIFTVPMATYDGSLGALFIVSVVALLIWVWTIMAKKKGRVTTTCLGAEMGLGKKAGRHLS